MCYMLREIMQFIQPLSCMYPRRDLSFQYERKIPSTVKPVYSGHLGTSLKCPDYQGVLIFQVSYMQMGTLGPLPSVLIIEVSLFSRVLINRFHCIPRSLHHLASHQQKLQAQTKANNVGDHL